MQQHPALTNFLRRLTMRSELTHEERNAVLALPGHTHQVRANYDIIQPGRETGEATLVVHGLAARFDPLSDGRRQITALYFKGDMCDLHSVVSPIAGWGLMALSNTVILKVPHAALKTLAIKFPALAFAFWRDTTADASIISKWVGVLGKRTSRSRMAHLLCEVALRLEAVGLADRDRFDLDMSQERLAEAVGMTAVHVNRTLQDLRSGRVIRSHGRTIEIPDWSRLAEVAEFDPTYLLLARVERDQQGLCDQRLQLLPN